MGTRKYARQLRALFLLTVARVNTLLARVFSRATVNKFLSSRYLKNLNRINTQRAISDYALISAVAQISASVISLIILRFTSNSRSYVISVTRKAEKISKRRLRISSFKANFPIFQFSISRNSHILHRPKMLPQQKIRTL